MKVDIRGGKDQQIDVSDIAKKLGGGGHKIAAGFTAYGELKEVIKRVTNFLEDYLEKRKFKG